MIRKLIKATSLCYYKVDTREFCKDIVGLKRVNLKRMRAEPMKEVTHNTKKCLKVGDTFVFSFAIWKLQNFIHQLTYILEELGVLKTY